MVCKVVNKGHTKKDIILKWCNNTHTYNVINFTFILYSSLKATYIIKNTYFVKYFQKDLKKY